MIEFLIVLAVFELVGLAVLYREIKKATFEKEVKGPTLKTGAEYIPTPKSREEVFGANKRYNPDEVPGMFDAVFEEPKEDYDR